MIKHDIDKFNPLNSIKLFGLKEYFNNFVKLYQNKKLPKVILLTGEKGIGKFTLSFHLVNSIFSTNNKHPYNYKDYLINIDNDSYKKILLSIDQNFNYIGSSKPNTSNIENIRDIKKRFNKSPLNNLPRFTILDDVELMNPNAANALLKLIEEPSIYDYFILINNKRNKMIETLKSRSLEVKVFLDNKNKQIILNSLINNFKINNDLLEEYVQFTTPGMFIRFSEILNNLKRKDETHYETIGKLLESFKKNKDSVNLDFIIFLLDINFTELIKNNSNNLLQVLEVKNKLTNLFDQCRRFNLNTDSVFSQFKIYSNYVR